MTSDFYTLSATAQAECLEALARRALPQWGLTENDQVTLIKHRENAVFKVVSQTGRQYALRVHRHGYHSDQALHSELQWMTYLNKKGLKTPRPVAALDGAYFQSVSSEGVPEARQCDLIEWVDGATVGGLEEGVAGDDKSLESIYRSIGEIAANLHNISTAWVRPPDFSRLQWDARGTIGDAPLWGRFWDLEPLTTAQKELFFKARDKALETLMAYGMGSDRFGLIHGDLLPDNILQTPDGLCLIDFDDSGFGWYMFEFATSLFMHLGESHFDKVCNAMVEGYRSVRPLPDEHLALFPTFFLMRGLVYLGWAHTRRETETAKALTPMIIEAVVALSEDYLTDT